MMKKATEARLEQRGERSDQYHSEDRTLQINSGSGGSIFHSSTVLDDSVELMVSGRGVNGLLVEVGTEVIVRGTVVPEGVSTIEVASRSSVTQRLYTVGVADVGLAVVS